MNRNFLCLSDFADGLICLDDDGKLSINVSGGSAEVTVSTDPCNEISLGTDGGIFSPRRGGLLEKVLPNFTQDITTTTDPGGTPTADNHMVFTYTNTTDCDLWVELYVRNAELQYVKLVGETDYDVDSYRIVCQTTGTRLHGYSCTYINVDHRHDTPANGESHAYSGNGKAWGYLQPGEDVTFTIIRSFTDKNDGISSMRTRILDPTVMVWEV